MIKKLARALIILGIILMGLTAVLTLLGGVGTVCAAWNPEKYGPAMAPLIPYKWLYQILVMATLVTAVAGFRVTYALLRRERWSYGGAIVVLSAGLILAGIQMVASYTLRGNTAPTNFRLYLTGFTLLVFLLLRLPGVRNRVDFTSSSGSPGSPAFPAGLALFLGGILTLTTPIWAGPTHTLDEHNLVNVLQLPLIVSGGTTLLIGLTSLILAVLGISFSALFEHSWQALADALASISRRYVSRKAARAAK